MSLLKLTPATLHHHATDTAYDRGEEYFQSGAVVCVTQRQDTLTAIVEGNEVNPYRITVDFDQGGITQVHCTCEYSLEGWCQHIIATLLTCIHKPETIEQRPSLSQLLHPLTLEQMRNLVQSLVEERPSLIEAIDRYASRYGEERPLNGSNTASTPRPQRKTRVNPEPFKRQVRDILEDAVGEWKYGRDEWGEEEDNNIGPEINALIQDALDFAQEGEGADAIIVLQGITEAVLKDWKKIYEFSGLDPLDVSIDFDAAWTEVLLSTELSEDEVFQWQTTLANWHNVDSFSMAQEALRQGWSYPPLVQVLQGDPSVQSTWIGEPPSWADELTGIRLKILEQEGRYEEYLNLARVEQHTQEYLTMLGKLGRVDQALAVAQTEMTTLAEAKALATILRENQHLQAALHIALQGLQLEVDSPFLGSEFAQWTSDLAEGLGQIPEALTAQSMGFKFDPSLQQYQKIQNLAGADWPNIQPTLMQSLRSCRFFGAKEARVDIFLYEGLLEEAIAVVSNLGRYEDNLILKVMDATLQSFEGSGQSSIVTAHGQWVIDKGCSLAEPIMSEGKADYYHRAVAFLCRVKQAYEALGQRANWSRYYQEVVSQHQRKRKLMGLMKESRLDK